MRAFSILVLFVAFVLQSNPSNAQTISVSEKAMAFADSLLKSFEQNQLDQYTDLCYPGVVKYYGGQKNFREYLHRARLVSREDASAQIKIVQIQNSGSEWQCVIEKETKCTLDSRRAHVISYIIGQSTDNGEHWTFVDVALNPSGSVVYIMPDIFETITVPQRQVIYVDNTLSARTM